MQDFVAKTPIPKKENNSNIEESLNVRLIKIVTTTKTVEEKKEDQRKTPLYPG